MEDSCTQYFPRNSNDKEKFNETSGFSGVLFQLKIATFIFLWIQCVCYAIKSFNV